MKKTQSVQGDETVFQQKVYAFYAKNKRTFLWRKTRDPYKILVSEVMLQQTQTARVIQKYALFIKKFPTVEVLAGASFREVLSVWQGLGYNRRAFYLWKAAQKVVKGYKGKIPLEIKKLTTLPGVGVATASAVYVFSKNKPQAFIETNIRSVFLHEFFSDKEKVGDTLLLPLVKKTMDRKNPREWYFALMDYGVYLKKTFKNPSRKSKHHALQSPFEGSSRQLRGKIIKELLKRGAASSEKIAQQTGEDKVRIITILTAMQKENLVKKNKNKFYIA